MKKKEDLIKEIEDSYGDFHDAVISSIYYERDYLNKSQLRIMLSTVNLLSPNLKIEKIELICSGITSIRFIELSPFSNLIVTNSKIIVDQDNIVLDFFPDIYCDRLEINEDSDFIVKFDILQIKKVN